MNDLTVAKNKFKKLSTFELKNDVINSINLLTYSNSDDTKITNVSELNELDNRIDSRKIRFYKIEELIFEDEFPRREIFENVISSLNNTNFNFIYYISGTPKGISIYLGIAENNKDPHLRATDFAKNVLEPSFTGNFFGSTQKI